MAQTQEAIIYKSARRSFECKLISTGEIIQAQAMGNLLKHDTLVVGDQIEVIADSLGAYTIHKLTDRRNLIFRRIIRENKIKPIASNLDLLLIVMTVSKPDYKRGMLDRFLTRACQWDIPTAIIFNKIDQDFDKDLSFDFEIERLKPLELEVFFTSALDQDLKHKDFPSLVDLKDFLANKTVIMLGQSGVGKSKLISALSNQEFELPSEAIGKVGKGTHTTTWTQMIEFDEFKIIDSPGIRTLSIQDITIDELTPLFPDLAQLFSKCKFNDCKHEDFSHGCFFNEPCSKEVLSRLESYKRIRDEILEIPDWKRPK